MVSDLEKNGLICQKKIALCFVFFWPFLKAPLWTNIEILPQIQDHIPETVFPELFFLFCSQSSKLAMNMRKLPVKLCNATIYPPWGPIFENSFFQKRTPPSSEMLDLLRKWHLNRIDEKNHSYFLSGALKVTILRNISRCLAFSRKWFGNHFYMAN